MQLRALGKQMPCMNSNTPTSCISNHQRQPIGRVVPHWTGGAPPSGHPLVVEVHAAVEGEGSWQKRTPGTGRSSYDRSNRRQQTAPGDRKEGSREWSGPREERGRDGRQGDRRQGDWGSRDPDGGSRSRGGRGSWQTDAPSEGRPGSRPWGRSSDSPEQVPRSRDQDGRAPDQWRGKQSWDSRGPRTAPPRDYSTDRSEPSDDWAHDEEGGEGWDQGWDEESGGAQRRQGPPDVKRSELIGEALYGVFPVLNALQAKRRRKLYTLYVLATLDMAARKDAPAVRAVLAAAADAGLEQVKVSRHELNMLSQDRPHQGLVLDCEPLDWQSLEAFPPASQVMAQLAGRPPPVWVALDEVTDPQNLGAILRSAWCLGAAGVLAAAKNCAPLSAAVSKASAGAMEVAPVHACKNMQRTLQEAASQGWAVVGASGADARAVDSAGIKITQPTILVMGNEGYGLRTNVRRACTGFVKVQMAYGFTDPAAATASAVTSSESSTGLEAGGEQEGAVSRVSKGSPRVDSLNVSVAAGILLHDLLTAARQSRS